MMIEKQFVEQISTAPVNTKFGSKTTYSFKAGGQWYKTAFKNHNLSVGDVVSFDFTTDSYGKQVDAKAIKRDETTASPAPSVSLGSGVPPRPTSSFVGSSKGVFPIPALDGQRSIVRQNALTNAREVITGLHTGAGSTPENIDALAKKIVALARVFESYTAGDMDMEEVKAEVEKEAKAKKAA